MAHHTNPKSNTGKRRRNNVMNTCEGYNSEDEHIRPRVILDEKLLLKYVDAEVLAKRLARKSLKIAAMAKDGNCMFRAVAHQLYGDQEMYDTIRKNCVAYMEKERDHFSQFVTEDFTDYLKRKRLDTVFGNHLELQAIAEIFNRPILIYVDDAEPLNLFQEEYKTDNPPIRLSYHFGNHYNSVFDPNHPTFGVGIGLPGLQSGTDKQGVKAAVQESERQILNSEMERYTIRESEQQVLNDQILTEITNRSEAEAIEAEFLDNEILESLKKETANDQESDYLESQYMDLIEADLLEQVKRASWTDY
jgi:OTU domain-containing protein 5